MGRSARFGGPPPAQAAMLAGVALFAGLSLVGSPFPDLAPLQNLPTLAIAGGGWALLRRWPMPMSAVACSAAFLLLHTIGGRYAYSYVPYDRWLGLLGLPTLADLFGLTRNGYDRLVYFSFGLLMVHPIACALRSHLGLSSRVALYIAVEFVFAGSALYKIFEWLLTLLMAGADAAAYSGQQGDMWDAQKDMACAAAGAMSGGAILIRRRRRG